MECTYCKTECVRAEGFARKYINKQKQIMDDITIAIAHKKYGVGGECLHRGYYCPSIIEDIVSGNISRGRLLSRPPAQKPASFTYYFDYIGRLVKTVRIGEIEVLLYDGTSVLGISFLGTGDVSVLTECTYSDIGQILCYKRFLFDPQQGRVIEFSEEKYYYSKNQMIVTWCRYAPSSHLSKSIMQQENYIFSAKDGLLINYTREEYLNGQRVLRPTDNCVYKVFVKRKIPNIG
jgi:hypothetical protein